MKLIEELIEIITGTSFSLTDALVKTKVLSFQLKNEELKIWVDNELNGYQNAELPNYRIISCQIIGHLSNGYQRVTNYPIPLGSLEKETQEAMTTVRLFQSVSSLDDTINSNSSKMVMNVPPEMYPYLSNGLDSGFVVEFARREISKSQVVQVTTAIRTKLLDFLLELKEEFGNSESVEKFTEGKGKELVNSIFSSAVFGNNTTIIVGDNNQQTLKNSNNSTGNFDVLAKQLLANGVKENDVEDLKLIIDNDDIDIENQQFGTKVNTWILKMMGKVMDNSWKVGLGAAGNLLAEGISKYYGWK